jgi:hypothetical protein
MTYNIAAIRQSIRDLENLTAPPPKPTPPPNYCRELWVLILPRVLEILQRISPLQMRRDVVLVHEALLTFSTTEEDLIILCHVAQFELRMITGDEVLLFSITDPRCFDTIRAFLLEERPRIGDLEDRRVSLPDMKRCPRTPEGDELFLQHARANSNVDAGYVRFLYREALLRPAIYEGIMRVLNRRNNELPQMTR